MARTYSEKSIKLLFGGARKCAFPGCEAGLIFEDRGELTVVAEIAHIRSELPNGPRYDRDYPAEKINLPENLLLLCGTHHKPVDEHPARYPASELERWKERQISEGVMRDLSERQVARIFQHYELNALGPEGFLKTCQALAMHTLGPGVDLMLRPKARRQYDAALDGRAAGYPSPEAPWEGFIVLEALYHSRPDEAPRALLYLKQRIRGCFEHWFTDERSKLRHPEYVIFATNIPLGAMPEGRAQVALLLDTLADHFGLKDVTIWDEAALIELIELYPDVRDAVRSLTASNELLNTVLGRW